MNECKTASHRRRVYYLRATATAWQVPTSTRIKVSRVFALLPGSTEFPIDCGARARIFTVEFDKQKTLPAAGANQFVLEDKSNDRICLRMFATHQHARVAFRLDTRWQLCLDRFTLYTQKSGQRPGVRRIPSGL